VPTPELRKRQSVAPSPRRDALRPAATGALGGTDPFGELVTQRRGIRGRKVDLVRNAVETERHGLVCGAAVNVVFEDDLNTLGHGGCSIHEGTAAEENAGCPALLNVTLRTVGQD
jgi:hypothetical protein